jgi:hypothetical protein
MDGGKKREKIEGRECKDGWREKEREDKREGV